jgi:DNA-binding FadR family transcriptional regulator
LIHRYRLSRATLREAARLLEDRHVAQMRRGPGGGLIVLPNSGAAIAPCVADHFHATGIDAQQIRKARAALRIAEAYRLALAEGWEARRAFTDEFRGRLAQGSAVGLLDPQAWPLPRSASGHIFTNLFGACLDAIEDHTCPRDPAIEFRPGLAHALARNLMRELPRAPVGGAPRLGTEDELCERHRVGREVLRQAVRLLESRGLIDSQRGRNHGLHAGASDSAALVERVVAYLSSVHLRWSELEPVAQVLSRIIRIVVVAESTAPQRREILSKLEGLDDRIGSPRMITALLHAEWAIAANPFLIFMERCATAYCARSSASIWKHFDDAEFRPLAALQRCMAASACGDVVRVDRIVEGICARVSALRNGRTFDVSSEARTALV